MSIHAGTQSVLGLGSALVDILHHVSDAFLQKHVEGQKGGRLELSCQEMDALLNQLPRSSAHMAKGGSAANTMAALAHLGTSAALLCKMGIDDAAQVFSTSMEKAGVAPDGFKITRDQPTGRCLSLITPDAERTMRVCLGAAADMSQSDIDAADFGKHRVFYMEGYTAITPMLFQKAIGLAQSSGMEIHLDLGSFEIVNQYRQTFQEALKSSVHAVYANELEATAITGCDSPEEALNRLSQWCPLAIVKLGAQGAILRQAQAPTVFCPACPVKRVVDTTAAGDYWAAGFLHCYLKGFSLHNAAAFASRVAAEIVQITGAELPPQTWDTLKHILTSIQ